MPKSIDASLVHPLNAELPMLVTLSGRITEVSITQSENALLGIAFIPVPIVADASLEHPLNIELPMLVTLFGISILVNAVQSLNA